MEKDEETDYPDISFPYCIFCFPFCVVDSLFETELIVMASDCGFISAHRRNRICLDN